MGVESLKKQPHSGLIDCLKRLVKRAESGDIISIAYVAQKGGGDFATGSINIDPVTTLGHLKILEAETVAAHYELYEIVPGVSDD